MSSPPPPPGPGNGGPPAGDNPPHGSSPATLPGTPAEGGEKTLLSAGGPSLAPGASGGQRKPGSLASALRSVKPPEWFSRLIADPVGRVVVAVAALGVCGLSLLVCVNLALLLPGTLNVSLPFGRQPTAEADVTPFTPSESLVFSSGVEVPLAVPQTLLFAGHSLPVAVATIGDDGLWQVPPGHETTAFWVYGSVVNYVFGLPDNADNLAAVDSLPQGASVEMQMSDGRALRFQVSRKLRVPVSQTDLFSQTQPGLTLALIGGRDQTRLVVESVFVGQSGPPTALGSSGIYELGEPAQAGDLLVTATATKLVTFGASELPSGLAYYLVDFVVENTGEGPVETSLVVSELIDANGSHYAPVIPVSAVTTYPPLAGRLNPNDVVNASAAFLVPVTFSDVGALWRFGSGPGADQSVQINLSPTVGTVSGPAVNVTVKSAELQTDGAELLVTGSVVNLGADAISVTENDLQLLSGTGETATFLRSDPPLPWRLDPSAFQSYEITFTRPTTTSVIFKLLGWEFELTGIE
jgi:hypothetical protein